MKIIYLILINIVIILISNVYCLAFDNKVTHIDITKSAINNSSLDGYLTSVLGLPSGIKTKYNGIEISSLLQIGSNLEDVPVCRAANHFHNPLLPWDQSQSTDVWPQDQICQHRGWTPRYSNITWATGLTSPTDTVKPRNLQDMGWDSARTYFYNALTSTDAPTRETLFAKSFQAVGQTMHLLQDMAVPAHVRNDFLSHLIYSSINLINLLNPADWVSNPFEGYVKRNPSLVSSISQIPTPTITGAIVSDFWDTDGRAGAPFSPGLAEYTNARYFSDFTIPGNPHIPFVQSHTFPLPQIPTYTCSDKLSEAIFKRKYASRLPCPTDGSPVDHFVAISMFTPRLLGLPSGPLPFFQKYALDDNVHNTYAKEILPLAVSYSTALLDYFFRGSIELSLPARGVYALALPTDSIKEIRVKAKNLTASGDEMNNGMIQLVVKYKPALSDPFQSESTELGPETYIVVPEKNNVKIIPKGTPTELVFDLSTSPLPLWATNVYLQVVYHGQLGAETDAVAVGFRDISEPTPMDVFNNADKVCINGQWYDAGSDKAIAQVDSNHDGIAEEWDVYAYNIANIFAKASSSSSATYASASNFTFSAPEALAGGNLRRLGYILTDYSFTYSFSEDWLETDPKDPWENYTTAELYLGTAVKNQTDSDGIHRYPIMYTFRGNKMWSGAGGIYMNWPYPDYSECGWGAL